MGRLKPFFPRAMASRGGDERPVLSEVIYIKRNGLRWGDAPREHGPPKPVMIDATWLKVHRTASGLRKKKGGPVISVGV